MVLETVRGLHNVLRLELWDSNVASPHGSPDGMLRPTTINVVWPVCLQSALLPGSATHATS